MITLGACEQDALWGVLQTNSLGRITKEEAIISLGWPHLGPQFLYL